MHTQHSRALITASGKVKHENVATTVLRPMHKPDTNWAPRSLSDIKLLGADLSIIRNLV